MKTKFYFLCIALLAFILPLAAQTGLEGFNYQTIVRDANGVPLVNAAVNFRFTITNQANSIQYQETQLINTNGMGLVNHVVGKGTVVQGTFASIPFQNADQKIQVDADISGGSNFQSVGNMILRSVPYALFAASGNAGPIGPQGPAGPQGIQGIAGPQGAQGIQGPAGAAGATGPQGPAGANGTNGVDGTNGADGLSVSTAVIDVNGDLILTLSDNSTVNAGSAVGPQGIQGVQGPAGADGIDGTNGLDGATGPQGIQGPAGADGANGADGLSVSTAVIDVNGDLILTLSDNSTLNAGSAVGPQGIQGVQGPAGADGIDGTNGLDGATGPQGPAGAD
ncbi:MAG: hypothetical protein ACKOW2_05495, partial [Sphingobacteriaceae bacterium]